MIGNNSCGVHALMGGKTVDNIHSLDIALYDGTQLTVRATTEEELNAIIAAGGRRGEIYAGLRRIRDQYSDLVRKRFPRIPRRVSGYNLDELLPENGFHVARALVGSEGTCAIVLGATVRLMHSPPYRALLVIGYPDLFGAGDHAAPIREYGPIGLEAFEKHVIDNMQRKGKEMPGAKLLPAGETWLIAEFGGETREEALGRAREAQRKIDATQK